MPDSFPVHLRDPYTEEIFDPQSFLLELADGRSFLINTETVEPVVTVRAPVKVGMVFG